MLHQYLLPFLIKNIYHITKTVLIPQEKKTPDVATNPIPNIYDRICRLLKIKKKKLVKKTIFYYANSSLKPIKSIIQVGNIQCSNHLTNFYRTKISMMPLRIFHLFSMNIFPIESRATPHHTPRNTLFYVLWLHIENRVIKKPPILSPQMRKQNNFFFPFVGIVLYICLYIGVHIYARMTQVCTVSSVR